MEKEQDGSQVLETETTEEATEQTADEPSEQQQEETVTLSKAELEDLKKKATERDEFEVKNKQLFERAKKAPAKSSDDLSVTDAVVLMQNGVKAEHFKDVIQAAKLLQVSIPEAMKNNVVKTILAQKTEEEKTASATQVKEQHRGSQKVTSEQVLQKFEYGELPDSEAEFTALAEARMFRNKPKARH